MTQKRILSGIKATGKVHLGNYFGAMKQFVEMQNEGFDTFVFIANLHSLTSVFNAEEMRQNTIDLVLDYLAIGLDPNKITLFLQSDISAHTELNWYFSNLMTLPEMYLCHSYKDYENALLENNTEKIKKFNLGVFNYPVLMAADILLYSPDFVPVGKDQIQHVEYARGIAKAFNNTYKTNVFKIPEAKIKESVATVPGIDGRKMSKSYGNNIPLFASPDEVREICKKIVTDSKRPEEKKDIENSNILPMYKLVASEEEYDIFLKRFESEGDFGIGYKEAKETLAEAIIKYFAPFREKRIELEKNPEYIYEVLRQGKEKANLVASAKMAEVRLATGIITS